MRSTRTGSVVPPSSSIGALLYGQRHDRFGSGHKLRGKVTPTFWLECYSLRQRRPGQQTQTDRGMAVPAGRLRLASTGPRSARTVSTGLDCCFTHSAVRPRLARSSSSASINSRVVHKVSGEWSTIHPTRLETRTKESNMCASRRALRTPKAQ